MIIRVAPESHFGWLAQRAAVSPNPATYRAVEALRPDGSIAAMVGFDGWTPNSVTADIACDSPVALRRLLPAAAVAAFDLGGVDIVRAVVRSDNAKSLRLCAAAGFRMVYRDRDGWAKGVDLVLFRMDKRDCRWLRPARKAA